MSRSGVFHWDPEKKCIVDGPAPTRSRRLDDPNPTGGKGGGGMFFQIPPGWSDGKPGIKYVEGGQFKGRVRFESRREAKELARRISDHQRRQVEYDP